MSLKQMVKLWVIFEILNQIANLVNRGVKLFIEAEKKGYNNGF